MSSTNPSVRKSATLSLIAIFIVYFTGFLFYYSQTVVLPRVAAELNGMALYSWAVSIPALAGAFVTLTFGKLSDMYGRRVMLLIALSLFLVGAVLGATSQTFVAQIVARAVVSLGQGALAPLCFAVLGDLFEPAERGKWAGFLNVPSGIAALVGPTLGGWLVDQFSWRYTFWIYVPLILISGALVMLGIPPLSQRTSHKIDFLGSVLLAIASSTMILGFSWAGGMYPWGSPQVIGMLVASVLFWALFLWVETRAAEPMLDPQVLTNRTFITAAMAGLISFFGLTAVMVYFPLFLQGVQSLSATLSGQVLTPFSVLMAFMGLPAGLLLARTRRYKWMYIVGYGILTAAMFGMVALTGQTPLIWCFLLSTLAGLGLGAIPTVNTLVAQYAVPRHLLGVATGAIYFFVLIGAAIAPAILGSAMNTTYTKTLEASLPAGLTEAVGAETLTSLGNPRVLLSPEAMAALEASFRNSGNPGPALFEQTVAAIRTALEHSLRTVFWIGAVTMAFCFLLILTIPEIPIGEK